MIRMLWSSINSTPRNLISKGIIGTLMAKVATTVITAAGLAFYLQWRYSTNHGLVDSNIDSQSIALGRKRNLFIPIISLLTIGVSFISPEWSTTVYLIIPLLHRYI